MMGGFGRAAGWRYAAGDPAVGRPLQVLNCTHMNVDPRSSRERLVARVGWYLVLVGFLAIVYGPVLGRGFVKDDFRWIAEGQRAASGDLGQALTGNVGFYRPVVTLTFALDYTLCGVEPVCYGLTNFVLLVACIAGIGALGRALGMPAAPAFAAAAIWSLNFHGIGGALLWTSGRTSLLATCSGVLATAAWLRGRHLVAVLWMGGALFSKEEALLLPLLLAASSRLGFDSPSVMPIRTRHLFALAGVAAAYLVLRHRSGAFDLITAPVYYTPTLNPAVLGRNVLEYFDRAGTWPLALLIAACTATRTRPRLGDCRRVASFGGVWFVLAHLPTLCLPVRSSLYTPLPSVGVALAAACLLAAVWRTQSPIIRRRLLVAAVLLPVVLYPVYVARTRRMAALTALSGRVIDALRAANARMADGRVVVMRDDRAVSPNLGEVFGTLLPEARVVFVPHAAVLWLDPPPESPAGVAPPRAPNRVDALVLTLRDGRLIEAGQ